MTRVLLVFLGLFVSAHALASADDEFAALLADEWAVRSADNPFLKDVIESEPPQPMSVAPEDYARRLAADEAFMARLRAIDRAALSPDAQLNYDIFDFVLTHRIEWASHRPWRMPFVSSNGFFNNIAITLTQARRESVEDFDVYIERIRALPAYFDQQIANMREGIADDFTMPREIMDGVVAIVEAQVFDSVEESPLWKPFTALPAHFSEADRRRLRAEGRAAIESQAMPGYRTVYDFFVDEYLPGARRTLAATDMPDGQAWYLYQLRYNTTLAEVSPDDIHELGLAEVARIRAEMEAIIAEVGFEGGFAEFLDYLRTDPQFYAKSADELLKEASFIAKRIDGVLPKYFNKMPRMSYGVFPVPEDIAPNYTPGRYWWPPIDRSTGGRYLVNTHALDKRPLYNLTALTLHESVPGHHLQVALSQEIEDAPPFRSVLYLMGHAEGWGLYSEKLGREMGIYRTPYDHFGQLTYEMWRATRLVVDTGLHWKGWSREEAVDYMAANTALSVFNIRTEVDRYVATPGQATAYKLGEIKIWELRRRAEDALGADFDLGLFHDIVIADGSMPLSLVEDRVDAWIAAGSD